MSKGVKGGEAIKRMVDLLRSGATMMSEVCPVCGSPLFKVGDEVRCPSCNKPVVFVKGEEEIARAMRPIILGMLEGTILNKIQEIDKMLKVENSLDKLSKLGLMLSTWLEVLERIKRILG